ncbi:prospero homeobox 3 [Paramormyrops kingsleyae]|uniref:prospero homeobox 3 n=1 Tax=Paramormyrops kingsleyae TaxID=1676925 RepID=UPI003B97221A
MDSSSDPLSQQASQIFHYGLYSSPPSAVPSAPRYSGGNPPSYPITSHLLHSGGPQQPNFYRHNQSTSESLDPIPDREHGAVEELAGRRAMAPAASPVPQYPSRGKKRPSFEMGDWPQQLVSGKRVCPESLLRRSTGRGEVDGERGGRGAEGVQRKVGRGETRGRQGGTEIRQRQRQELKVLLQETRGKLLELQEKVCRAYGERRSSRRREDGELTQDDGLEMFSEDEDTSDFGGMSLTCPLHPSGGNSVEKRTDGNPGNGKASQQGAPGEGRVLLDCGLVRGEWEAGGDGGPKFAQALKRELGSAVARVIDRVTHLYTQSYPSSTEDPPPAEGVRSKKEEFPKVNKAPPSLGLPEPGPLVPNRVQEKMVQNPNASQNPLFSQLNSSLHPLPRSHIPAQLPSEAKDPFLSSYPPAPPPMPLPLLHYTMQHLFARSLSNFPLHKDCLPTDSFLDFSSHTPSFPPMPLLGQMDASLSTLDREGGGRGQAGGMLSGYMDGGDSSIYLPGGSSQEGLSPCHLKKAKLMFFYTRYPSSNTLKTYFPDVKFNRCITSQLIKWFSNFREFFYIQMERFARQAVREGLSGRGQGALRLGRDSELYRILNLHYNKSNDYQVPDRFVEVSELALREFLNAIQAGRDTDPCWKKSIYKIICKLDSPVPDSFRLPGCPLSAAAAE